MYIQKRVLLACENKFWTNLLYGIPYRLWRRFIVYYVMRFEINCNMTDTMNFKISRYDHCGWGNENPPFAIHGDSYMISDIGWVKYKGHPHLKPEWVCISYAFCNKIGPWNRQIWSKEFCYVLPYTIRCICLEWNHRLHIEGLVTFYI